jgi:hypothetical protein
MIGPFKLALGGFRWVHVAIDKFSKWIKYKPLVQATTKKAAELLNDIIHRFGLPNSIITDLGLHLPTMTFGTSVTSDASQSSMSRLHAPGLTVRLNALRHGSGRIEEETLRERAEAPEQMA